MSRGRRLALLAGALAGIASSRAHAASSSCGRADLFDVVPTDGATAVPDNASFFAHYDPSAEYVDEVISVRGPDGALDTFDGQVNPLVVSWDGTQGLLTVKLPPPLASGKYQVSWPSLRGLNSAAPGEGGTVSFTVGNAADTTAPVFDGLTTISWDLERRNNDCTDSLEDRLVFDLGLAPASDDGGRAGLTLVVFQTAGGAVDGGAVQVLTEAMPAEGAHVQVRLPIADATGHVCFSALARDLTSKISNGGSHDVCVETKAPPFFRGCAVAAGRQGLDGSLTAFASLLLVAAARARRTRRR